MSSRSLASALAALLAVGCDDAPPPAAADAAVEDPCPDVALARGPWALHRCAAPGRYALRRAGRPVLDAATAGLVVAGAPTLGDAWPDVVWAAQGDGQDVLFVGHPTLPALRLHIALDPVPRVHLTVDEPAAPLPIDALLPLVATAPGAPRATLPTFATAGDAAPPPRPVAQALIAEESLLIHAFTPEDALAEVALAPTPTGTGITVQTLGLATTLGPGDRLAAPAVEVDQGPDVYALLEAAGARLGPRTTAAPTWGWRSGGAYGALVSAAAVERELAALRALAADRAAPTLLLDGLWFAALGAWEDAEGFPAGLADSVARLGDARVALRWPALWVSAEATACPGDCPATPTALDPGRPAVQDLLGRAAVGLAAAGVQGLVLREEATTDEAARRGLGRALAPFAGPVFGSTPAALGVLDGLSLAAPSDDPGAACWEEAFRGPRSAACAAALADPTPAAAEGPAPHDLARALAAWRHLAGRVAVLDPGPVVVARPAGEARQAALLAAIAGGPRLLGDAPSRLSAAQAAPYFATLDAPGLAHLQPVGDADDAPAVWLGPAAVAVFNFTDAPRAFTLPAAPALAGAPAVFGGPAFAPGATVTVDAHDAAAWALPAGPENMQ